MVTISFIVNRDGMKRHIDHVGQMHYEFMIYEFVVINGCHCLATHIVWLRPLHRRPDITKIKTTLGWEPKVPLRDGLLLMVDDFKKRLGVN